MELKGRKPYRTTQVVFTSFDEEGEEHKDTLNIKYKPVDETWFELFESVREKIERLKDEGLRLVAKLAEEENTLLKLKEELQQASDIEVDGQAAETENEAKEVSFEEEALETLQQAYDVQKQKVDELSDQIDALIKENKKIQSQMLAEQLSPILISLDMTFEGKPFEPTVENLVFLGIEFCIDVLEAIQKKVRRQRMI